ncbi:hypothetical protein [Xenorhabdus griffiniae]|uniref:DNA replication protein n=1 Tax=Xenorhabdus griffiniae TaxID=351672 RepID=A0ABY9XL54_9GAMM|nr:hypothetical protein [Xenorhabdus griffiniae]MBD1229237.1 hypothetical protein [Xenorhabdus griffiniae]MBE8588994.1 hypothetical protein [Xenorhabdus griffiniae]WMV73507.1 hypothetical protein QL128_05650 [Xenorhabdus griffiniae]WNH03187.1 hypothetical protein QL112_005655 [Xenorhabdus griffiniae]
MARSRNIKPGFFTNDDLAECEPLARLLFAGLWTIADREGRLEDKPRKIKAMILPYDDANCDDLLQQLHKKNFITRYAVDGNEFIQINNWKKHQNPHCKEAASEIPKYCESSKEPKQAQEENKESTEQEQCKNSAEQLQIIENTETQEKHSTNTVQEQYKNNLNPADSLNLIPDSFNPINTQAENPACVEENQNRPASVHPMSSKYAFEGQIIRLNHKDYSAWKNLYPNIDLLHELQRLDLEFQAEKPKKWFITTSQKLNYQNNQQANRYKRRVGDRIIQPVRTEQFISEDF